MASRRVAFWVEGTRAVLVAALPLLLGRWFGVAHLGGYAAIGILVIFGPSALALPWLGGASRPAHVHHDAVAG